MAREATDTREIHGLLRPLLERALRDVKILAVNIRRSTDADGDPVLWITVVYDDAQRRGRLLDPKVTAGMVRRVRPRMLEAGEEAFPVFSYVAKSDLGKTKPDAA